VSFSALRKIAPADTLQAILNIAQNPGNNVGSVFNIVSGSGPFTPVLAAAPNDWTLALTFTGPLARSLALVAIVIGGLLFMFGEAGAKRQISGIVFGGGLALFAAQFLTWLF